MGNVSRTSAYVALGLLAAINAFNYVDRAALSLVLPLVQHDLHLSDTALGVISGLPFSLCYALCSLPAAYIADHFSRRNLMAIGFTLWSAMTCLSGAAGSGLQLAGARLALGAGESVGLPTTASLIADLFTGRRRAAPMRCLRLRPTSASCWVFRRSPGSCMPSAGGPRFSQPERLACYLRSSST